VTPSSQSLHIEALDSASGAKIFKLTGPLTIQTLFDFQHLVRHMGEFATVLPVGILFGLLHLGNQNVTLLAVINTIAWGVLLGCAYLRTRALWLPIGMHFGWNAATPFLGVNLSGFTIAVTGYELHWRTGVLWSGGAYGLEGGLFTTLVVAGLFVLLYRVIPQRG